MLLLFFKIFEVEEKIGSYFRSKIVDFFLGYQKCFFQKLLFLPKLSLQDDYDFD